MTNRTNPWKSSFLGLCGGAAGVVAMDYYFSQIAPRVSEALHTLKPQDPEENDTQEQNKKSKTTSILPKNISLVGKQYREGEVSTEALGRILYTRLTGQELKSKETKTVLSFEIHWAYGILQGAAYGAWRSNAPLLDVGGGAAFGTGLWLLGDETTVPMLGLQAGPGTVTMPQRVNRLGAHLTYGLVTALTTQLLRRLI